MSEEGIKETVYAKWAAVYGALQNIDLDAKHPEKGYRYASGAEVLQTIRPILAQHMLVIDTELLLDHPQAVRERYGDKSFYNRVVYRYRLVDAENPESKTDWKYAVGDAVEYGSGDKGHASATTYCLKRLVQDVFLIRADDEPDTDANVEPKPEPKQRQQRQEPPPRQQTPREQRQQPPPLSVVSKNGASETHPPTTTSGQPQPAPTQADESQANASQSPSPLSSSAQHTVEVFKSQAAALGFNDRGVMITTLSHFGFSDKYSSDQHDAMIEALTVWASLDLFYRGLNVKNTLADELNYLVTAGLLTKPYTAAALKEVSSVIQAHAEFNRAAIAITPDAGALLKQHGLLPWKPTNGELALQTLRNHVENAARQQEMRKAAEVAAEVEQEPAAEEENIIETAPEQPNDLVVGDEEAEDDGLFVELKL